MWVKLPSNADWDCFKTPILQEILRIQNLRQVERYAFLEVIHLFQSAGCVRTNFCFAQFNRIRNHLVGHWTEIGWFARSGTMGSDRRSSWKHEPES